jgi:hypothetical protein
VEFQEKYPDRLAVGGEWGVPDDGTGEQPQLPLRSGIVEHLQHRARVVAGQPSGFIHGRSFGGLSACLRQLRHDPAAAEIELAQLTVTVRR